MRVKLLVWKSAHGLYQSTFSTSGLLGVGNHIENGCSATAGFTGTSAGLCV